MSLTATRPRPETVLSPEARARRVRIALDYLGLWLVRGGRRGKSAARTVAESYECSESTVEKHTAWAIRTPGSDTEKVRLARDLIPRRRTNPRGADPRS